MHVQRCNITNQFQKELDTYGTLVQLLNFKQQRALIIRQLCALRTVYKNRYAIKPAEPMVPCSVTFKPDTGVTFAMRAEAALTLQNQRHL